MTKNDVAALNLAIEHELAKSPDGVVKQYLDEGKWLEAGKQSAYSCQWDTLQLRIHQITPCFILDPAEVLATPQTEPNHGEHQAAQLLKQMLACGVSRYHPDPVAAIADATRRKARR